MVSKQHDITSLTDEHRVLHRQAGKVTAGAIVETQATTYIRQRSHERVATGGQYNSTSDDH